MLQGFGRPGAAANLHVCVAEYFSSMLHVRVKRSFAAVSTHMHTCVIQNKSIRGCTPKSRVIRAWPIRCCCEHACRMSQHRLAWITDYTGWPTSRCCEQTHAHTYAWQKKCRVEPEDQGSPGVWPTKCYCEHARVCFRKTNQGCIQGSKLTRDWPTNRCCEHTHMCFAEYINSGLHLSVKGYNALADQLLLREHTCDMCVAEKVKSGLVWPTTS